MSGVIKLLKSSLKTHIEWAEYFEQNPESEQLPEYRRLGDAKFHRVCEKNYKKAITEIVQLQAGNKMLSSIDLGVLRGYQAGYEDAVANKKPRYYVKTK